LLMTQAPADKTARRIKNEAWYAHAGEVTPFLPLPLVAAVLCKAEVKKNPQAQKSAARHKQSKAKAMMVGGETALSGFGAGADTKVLHAFQTSFVQVQSLLDQNRALIDEINQNHESKVPADLSRNVGLIRDLNSNIRRVVDLYADLSSFFAATAEGGSVGTSVVGHKRIRSGLD
jgi:hypothetical protein